MNCFDVSVKVAFPLCFEWAIFAFVLDSTCFVVLLFVSLPLILKLEAFITIRAFESDNRMKSFLVIQVLSPAFKLQVTLSTMDSFSGSLLLPCFFCESVSPNMYVGFSLSFEHHFTFSTFFVVICC